MVLALEEIDECRIIGGSLEWNNYQSSVLILLALSAQGISSSIAFRIAAIRVASRRRLVLPPIFPLKHRLNARIRGMTQMGLLPPQKSNDVQTTFHFVFPELPPGSFSCYRGFIIGQDLEHIAIRGNLSTRKPSCSSKPTNPLSICNYK